MRFSCHVVFSRNQISCYTRTRCSILIWICVLMIKSSRMIEIFVSWNSNKLIWIWVWVWVCEQINLNSRFDMNQSEQSLQVSFYSFSNEIYVLTRKILWIDSNLCLDWKIKEIYLNLYFWWEKSSVPIMCLIDDLSCNSSWKIPKWLTQNNWIFKIANSQFLLLKFHGLILGL